MRPGIQPVLTLPADMPIGRYAFALLTGDLRIVLLRSNRISNRIGRPIRFRVKFSNRIGRIYHASRNTV